MSRDRQGCPAALVTPAALVYSRVTFTAFVDLFELVGYVSQATGDFPSRVRRFAAVCHGFNYWITSGIAPVALLFHSRVT